MGSSREVRTRVPDLFFGFVGSLGWKIRMSAKSVICFCLEGAPNKQRIKKGPLVLWKCYLLSLLESILNSIALIFPIYSLRIKP